ncbi:MAG: hypothetical protein KAT85_01980, partial [candidate division Zixibacteria bacterium]|nr:hypothetical protein [candidate division Zixibacteria bacterium]
MKRILDTVPILACIAICISLHVGCGRQDNSESTHLDSDSLSTEELVQRADFLLRTSQPDSAYKLSGIAVERKMMGYGEPD